jgi:hypothetical protein
MPADRVLRGAWDRAACLAARPQLAAIADFARIEEGNYALWAYWVARLGVARMQMLLTGVAGAGRCEFADAHPHLVTASAALRRAAAL